MIGTMKRDRLVDKFYSVEVTMTSWRVFFGLCKLFLRS
jgi:hypothetical protein